MNAGQRVAFRIAPLNHFNLVLVLADSLFDSLADAGLRKQVLPLIVLIL